MKSIKSTAGFGKFLAKKRIAKKLPLRTVANSLGVTAQTIHNVEHGKNSFVPTIVRMEILRDLLKLSDSDYIKMLNLAGRQICTTLPENFCAVAPDVSEYCLKNYDKVMQILREMKEAEESEG